MPPTKKRIQRYLSDDSGEYCYFFVSVDNGWFAIEHSQAVVDVGMGTKGKKKNCWMFTRRVLAPDGGMSVDFFFANKIPSETFERNKNLSRFRVFELNKFVSGPEHVLFWTVGSRHVINWIFFVLINKITYRTPRERRSVRGGAGGFRFAKPL